VNCKYHPDKEAQAGCVGCGGLVCPECDVLVAGRHFCRKCLAEAADSRPPAGAAPAAPVKKLYRSRRDRWLAGVCGGLARYTGTDAAMVRVVTVVAALLTGGFAVLIGYIVAACVIPEEPLGAEQESGHGR